MPKQPNHNADIKNANKGSPGTNRTYDQAQGNRGKQLDPKQQPSPKPAGGKKAKPSS